MDIRPARIDSIRSAFHSQRGMRAAEFLLAIRGRLWYTDSILVNGRWLDVGYSLNNRTTRGSLVVSSTGFFCTGFADREPSYSAKAYLSRDMGNSPPVRVSPAFFLLQNRSADSPEERAIRFFIARKESEPPTILGYE